MILIIENNLINRDLAGKILEANGLDVRYASDALSGLTMLTKVRPTLILIGLSLPKIDGLTLTRILKNDYDTSELKIVALVDLASSDDFSRSLLEFDGHIAIPFEEAIFLKTVKPFFGNTQNNNTAIKQTAHGNNY